MDNTNNSIEMPSRSSNFYNLGNTAQSSSAVGVGGLSNDSETAGTSALKSMMANNYSLFEISSESTATNTDPQQFDNSLSSHDSETAGTSAYDTDRQQFNSQYVVSIFWNHGYLAVAYYEVSTMELFVSAEAMDLKPDYPYLDNLFHQIYITDLICSGPIEFIKKVMELGDLPADDYEKYYVRQHNPITARSFVIYTNSLRTLDRHRKRILKMHLPGMPSGSTEHQRKMFLESILPLHQESVVQSLGNLLQHLDANWRHLFLMDNSNPIITDCNVIVLDNQLLIDECTMLGLQIFSPTERHPSGFKRGAEREVKEGLSLFAIFDRCASKIGRWKMKAMLQQPTQDLEKLHDRQNVIEWCLQKTNASHLKTVRVLLSKLVNITQVYPRLTASALNTKYRDWMALYDCLSSIHRMSQLCRKIVNTYKYASEPIVLLEELAMTDQQEFEKIEKLMEVLARTFDVDESKVKRRFIVKRGCCEKLDAIKDRMQELQMELREKISEEIHRMPLEKDKINVEFFDEIGVVFEFTNDQNLDQNRIILALNQSGFEIMYIVKHQFHFKSLALVEINKEYSKQGATIRYEEHLLAEATLHCIKPKIGQFQKYLRLCAKFDCLIAMASVAADLHLVRPEILTENTIEIHYGRHILLEHLTCSSTANDTFSVVGQPNRITILTAPNTAGKSVYLKQIALIVYMTHIGSFVAASSARIGRFDAIYTRMYVPETLRNNASLFLVELQQLRKLMIHSSARSLVIVDEFGQSTTMNEGRAMLGAAVMCLADRGPLTPITFISTHFLDLIDILPPSPVVCSQTIVMSRNANNVLESTYKVVDGRCSIGYASGCAGLSSAMKEILEKSVPVDEPSSRDSTTNDPEPSADGGTKEKKIQVAYDIFKMYVDNGGWVDEAIVERMMGDVELFDT